MSEPKLNPRLNPSSYDVIIIGSGAAGSVAAQVLVNAGKSVALVEHGRIGGTYTVHTSVPLRSLSHLAQTYNQVQRAQDKGLKTRALGYSWPAMVKSALDAAHTLSATVRPSVLKKKGVQLIHGHAKFISQHEISVGRQRLKASKFLIASGSSEYLPPVMGLKEAGYTTASELLKCKILPKKIAIIGGGQTAVELATIAHTFGSGVVIFERKPHLLPQLDSSVGRLTSALYKKRGIEIITGTHRMRADKVGRKRVISVTNRDNSSTETTVDEIVIASGMRPNIDLSLPSADVLYNESGITVNKQLQTTTKNIWAAGDVIGAPHYVHVAAYQGRVAAHNILHRSKTNFPNKAVPAVIFAEPEIAVVGAAEDQLKSAGKPYKVCAARLSDVARGITDDPEQGFVKIITTPTGHILGAAIVGPHAGEMIHEPTLAINTNLHIDDIATTMHAFPSWSEAIRLAASKF